MWYTICVQKNNAIFARVMHISSLNNSCVSVGYDNKAITICVQKVMQPLLESCRDLLHIHLYMAWVYRTTGSWNYKGLSVIHIIVQAAAVSSASIQWSSLSTYQNVRGVYIDCSNWGTIQCVDSVTYVMCSVLKYKASVVNQRGSTVVDYN